MNIELAGSITGLLLNDSVQAQQRGAVGSRRRSAIARLLQSAV
ncbi:hypothetical protein [Actinoplanes xinjiangensis]